MELLCTLSRKEDLERYIDSGVDGLIYGSAFSLRFNYSLEEMKYISNYCYDNNIKRYISIDAMIFEEDMFALFEYFDFLKNINPDGIYFTDLGIIGVAKKMGFGDKLIYDPDTLMCNSLDVYFYLKQKIGVVLARELSFDEVNKILNSNLHKVDMQVFGHLKMSYSKRKFLTNYFKFLGKEVKVNGKRSIKIVEENRDYCLPIIEDKYGTRIYSDYVLLMYKQYLEIKGKLNRAIVEDSFVKQEIVCDVLRDLRMIDIGNVDDVLNSLLNKYPDELFSVGYLDTKTTKTKEENE